MTLSKDVIARLRCIMKYGDSYSSAIDKVLTVYEQVTHTEVKDSK